MTSLAQSSWRWFTVTALITLAACAPEPTRVIQLPDPQFAKGGGPTSSVTVSAATPGFGKRGERLSVRITGTGFNSNSAATWERGGVADPNVTVLSTTFVSSTEVVADIQIGNDADLVLYDVAVTITLVDGGRKKGVGIEKFEVTSATRLPSLGGGTGSAAWSLNDAGQVVGRSNGQAFFWSEAFGIESLGSGEAIDITESGTTVVGMNNSGTPRDAMVWTGRHGNWSAAKLSTACVADVEWSMARSIAKDGSLIGGRIAAGKARQSKQYPVLWDSPTSNCRTLSIPTGWDGGRVADVNALGMATGVVHLGTGNLRAIVWEASGTPTILQPVSGDDFSQAFAIAPNGTIVVGMSGDRSAYWVRTQTGWSSGLALSPKCGNGQNWARGVNSLGVIVGNACDGGRWWRIVNGVVDATQLMPGLGPTDHPVAEAITDNTLSGQPWAAGGSAYWRLP